MSYAENRKRLDDAVKAARPMQAPPRPGPATSAFLEGVAPMPRAPLRAGPPLPNFDQLQGAQDAFELGLREDNAARAADEAAAERATRRRMTPGGMGALAMPMSNTFTDPAARDDVFDRMVDFGVGTSNFIDRNVTRPINEAARDPMGFAGDVLDGVRGLPQMASAGARGLQTAARQAPGAVRQFRDDLGVDADQDWIAQLGDAAIRLGPHLAGELTVAPFAREEQSMQALDYAREMGDEEGAEEAARARTPDALFATLNAIGGVALADDLAAGGAALARSGITRPRPPVTRLAETPAPPPVDVPFDQAPVGARGEVLPEAGADPLASVRAPPMDVSRYRAMGQRTAGEPKVVPADEYEAFLSSGRFGDEGELRRYYEQLGYDGAQTARGLEQWNEGANWSRTVPFGSELDIRTGEIRPAEPIGQTLGTSRDEARTVEGWMRDAMPRDLLNSAAPIALGAGTGALTATALSGQEAEADTGEEGFDLSDVMVPLLGAGAGAVGARSIARMGAGPRSLQEAGDINARSLAGPFARGRDQFSAPPQPFNPMRDAAWLEGVNFDGVPSQVEAMVRITSRNSMTRQEAIDAIKEGHFGRGRNANYAVRILEGLPDSPPREALSTADPFGDRAWLGDRTTAAIPDAPASDPFGDAEWLASRRRPPRTNDPLDSILLPSLATGGGATALALGAEDADASTGEDGGFDPLDLALPAAGIAALGLGGAALMRGRRGPRSVTPEAPPVVESPMPAETPTRPRMTPNQQLYSRPHGPRAQAILERQDAEIKASDAALRQLNDDTRRAFEAQGARDMGDALDFAEGRADDFGDDAFDYLTDAERVGPMQGMSDLLRQQSDWDRATSRLGARDFNVPRSMYNALPLALGSGLGASMLLGDEAEAQEGLGPIPNDIDVREGTWSGERYPVTLADGTEAFEQDLLLPDGRVLAVVRSQAPDGSVTVHGAYPAAQDDGRGFTPDIDAPIPEEATRNERDGAEPWMLGLPAVAALAGGLAGPRVMGRWGRFNPRQAAAAGGALTGAGMGASIGATTEDEDLLELAGLGAIGGGAIGVAPRVTRDVLDDVGRSLPPISLRVPRAEVRADDLMPSRPLGAPNERNWDLSEDAIGAELDLLNANQRRGVQRASPAQRRLKRGSDVPLEERPDLPANERGSLPHQIGRLQLDQLRNLARELGLDNTGGKRAIAERIASAAREGGQDVFDAIRRFAPYLGIGAAGVAANSNDASAQPQR